MEDTGSLRILISTRVAILFPPDYIASNLTHYLNAYYSDIYSFSYSGVGIYGVLKDSRQATGFMKISSNGNSRARLSVYSDTGTSSYSLPITHTASALAQAQATGQDPDEISTSSTTYLLQASQDQVTWLNTSATSMSLQPDNSFQGKYIRAIIRYVNNSGFEEFAYSSSSYVVYNINSGNGGLGSIDSSVSGVFREGMTLVAPMVTGDPDGDSMTPNYGYQW